jgi:phage terminase large subunit-like protein
MTHSLSNLSNTSDSNLQAVLNALQTEQIRRQTECRLTYFRPYPKQLDFLNAGATYRERLLMTCNRFGKTFCGAAEMAFHLTGLYPEWWKGKRFEKPVRAWAAGVTGETTRDVVQTALIGPPHRRAEWGTGLIPKHCIGDVSMAHGTADLIDTVSVLHVSGGYSQLQFKSYSAGREKWQGTALEVLWCDEEPPSDIYTEGLTRTNETGGIVYITFTSLQGISNVVRRFLYDS